MKPIPLINFTDRGIFASRADGSEKSPVSKSCSWDTGRPAVALRSAFYNFFAWNCNFVTVWVRLRCPAWMNDSCAGLLPRGGLPSGCPGQSCKRGFRFLFGFCRFFYAVFSSPGMMVPVHAGRGHLHATRPPVVLET